MMPTNGHPYQPQSMSQRFPQRQPGADWGSPIAFWVLFSLAAFGVGSWLYSQFALPGKLQQIRQAAQQKAAAVEVEAALQEYLGEIDARARQQYGALTRELPTERRIQHVLEVYCDREARGAWVPTWDQQMLIINGGQEEPTAASRQFLTQWRDRIRRERSH